MMPMCSCLRAGVGRVIGEGVKGGDTGISALAGLGGAEANVR